MAEWTYLNNKIIEHRSGFRIQLQAGSWSNPSDLSPVNTTKVQPMEAARLLREGLAFAQENAIPADVSNFIPKRRRAQTANTLSLKRKEKA